ncbi:MAG TPA: O-antigen ligase family protein [Bacillota bacterium]
MLMLLAVLVLGPYFRGLYFVGEQLVVAALLGAVFLLHWLQRFAAGDYAFVRSALDALVWALVAAYLLALVVAVEPRAAVQELIKVTACAIVYSLVRDGVRSHRAARWLLHALLIAGTYLAVLGVAAAAGQFTLKDAVLGHRIASTLQYPNTLAAFLTVTFILGLTLWQVAVRTAERLWAVAASYLCLFVLVFTYSRGGWLVFALALALLWLVQPAGRRLRLLAMAGMLIAVFAPFGVLYSRALQSEAGPVPLWLAYLGGVPVVVVLAWLSERLPPWGRRERLFACIAAAVGVLGVAGYVLTTPELVPRDLLSRLTSISLEDHSAWSRIQWSRDALAMIAQRPVLGAGGGAWDALYHGYQSYNYFSRQVHNHFFQLWLEVGTIGFAIWLGIWLVLAVILHRAYWRWGRSVAPPAAAAPHRDSDRATAAAPGRTVNSDGAPILQQRCVVGGTAVAAFALGLHSLIDFNLALTAVALALWALFGLGQALADVAAAEGRPQPRGDAGYQLLPRLGVYALCGVLVAGSLSLAVGHAYGQQGARALNEGRPEQAAAAFDRALRFDPLTASFYFDRARLYARGVGDQEPNLARARAFMERGLELDPYDANLHALYGEFLFEHGDPAAGIAELERAAELHPFAVTRWENLARAHFLVAAALLERQADKPDEFTQAHKDQLQQHLEAVLAIAERVAQLAARVPEPVPASMRTPPTTPELAWYVGRAAALLERWDLAVDQLRITAEAEARGDEGDEARRRRADALLWLGVVYERTARSDEAGRALQQAYELQPELRDAYPTLQRLLAENL